MKITGGETWHDLPYTGGEQIKLPSGKYYLHADMEMGSGGYLIAGNEDVTVDLNDKVLYTDYDYPETIGPAHWHTSNLPSIFAVRDSAKLSI